ncbi:hypothetical protein [Nitrosomonas aestuarii]|uniref:hypothetical protein n=1 Tax=Nitrosomonas aestuarii TaxID=52441 RepID=UPI000D4D1DE2|nr:hypothetical protein [Nitrosomonas aestuarii]PTN09712.1 hypothetical protein C8R11_12252 [Nitrosomonas aestuarii]
MKSFKVKILLTIMLCICGNYVHAQDFDVIGLKLGMTVEEVHKVLKDYDVESNIKEHRQYYNYSDGVEHFKTDDFVYYIDAIKRKENNDYLSIFFSPGPQGGRVVAVTRTLENKAQPPTRGQYLSALKKKYGQPTSEDISTVHWDFPAGKIQCLVGAIGAYQPTHPSILKKIYSANVGSRDGIFHNSKVKSLSDCASYLTYSMPSGDNSPVTEARAIMVDVAGIANGELAANEWVDGLAEQARKAREAKGEMPDL